MSNGATRPLVKTPLTPMPITDLRSVMQYAPHVKPNGSLDQRALWSLTKSISHSPGSPFSEWSFGSPL